VETLTFKVFRYDPSREAVPYWALYDVPVDPGDTVLTGLMYIREVLDGTLAFRASCRAGICGSDGMVINGRARLSCKTQARDVADDLRVVQLEPLRNLPCLKDLVVDQGAFWEKFRAAKPWLINEEPPPVRERLMALPEDEFRMLSKASDCIFCQICYSECPINGLERAFLGPQALIKAYQHEFDPRDRGEEERLAAVSGADGVWRCRTTFNCTVSCPKGIPITHGIQLLKQKSASRLLTGAPVP
jgi:succinate dehydrogenase / fumarate reductase iron-sulfur subunit